MYNDIMSGPPRAGFLFASPSDVGVFNVKVLLERNELLLRKINVVEALTEIRAPTKGACKTSGTTTAVATATTAVATATATAVAAATAAAGASTSGETRTQTSEIFPTNATYRPPYPPP